MDQTQLTKARQGDYIALIDCLAIIFEQGQCVADLLFDYADRDSDNTVRGAALLISSAWRDAANLVAASSSTKIFHDRVADGDLRLAAEGAHEALYTFEAWASGCYIKGQDGVARFVVRDEAREWLLQHGFESSADELLGKDAA